MRSRAWPRGSRVANPFRESKPVRIILRSKLPAAGVEWITACFGGKRMDQKRACDGISGDNLLQGTLEVALRLLVGPILLAKCEFFEMEKTVGLAVTHIAANMRGTLLQKNRLNSRFEVLKVEGSGLRREGRLGIIAS